MRIKGVNRLARKPASWVLGTLRRHPGICRTLRTNSIAYFATDLVTKINPRVSTDIMGQKMLIRPYCFPNLAASLLNDIPRRHEGPAFPLFKSLLKKGMYVVDAGANSGWCTLNACNVVGERGKVFAFEADERNFKVLMENIKLNNYTNARAFQVTLSDQVKLNQFIDKVDLINIDVEGNELAVLKGVEGVLTQDAKIICEVHPWISTKDHQEIYNLLLSQGFRLSFANLFDKEFRENMGINKSKIYMLFADRGK